MELKANPSDRSPQTYAERSRRGKMPIPRSYQQLTTGRKIVIKTMVEAGVPYRQIAAMERVSVATVHGVAHDNELIEMSPEIVAKTKAALSGRAYILADRSISKAGEETRLDKMNSYQLTVMGSIMIDKARLMDGMSTENLALHTMSERLQSGAKDIDNVKNMILKRFQMISDNDSSTENDDKSDEKLPDRVLE